MKIEENGWNEWSKHVLLELKSHKEKLDALECKITNMQIQLATIKKEMEISAGNKGAMMGGVIAVVVSVIGGLLTYFFTHPK